MAHRHQRISTHRPRTHTTRLLGVIEKLSRLEADLIRDGMSAEAGSVATTRADLEWQYEELLVSTQIRSAS